MNIQKTSGVNFGATRVLTASKGNKVIDIFKLDLKNKNDIHFIKRCQNTYRQRVRHRSDSGMAHFFRRFLNKYEPCHSGDYYIGIKDGETIVGGFCAETNRAGVFLTTNFINDYRKISTDTMLYSLLADSQKSSPEKNIYDCLESIMLNRHYCDCIPASQIDNFKKNIKARNSSYKFETGNNEEVHLESLLGINDINSQLIL